MSCILRFARLENFIWRVMHDPPFLCACLTQVQRRLSERKFSNVLIAANVTKQVRQKSL